MAEAIEVPKSFQKTVDVQQARLDFAEKPTGFGDNFTGKHVSGSFWASYAEGIGGQVDTRINSGRKLESSCPLIFWTIGQRNSILQRQECRLVGIDFLHTNYRKSRTSSIFGNLNSYREFFF